MDFEQMQVVWDEQKQQRVYALDLDALHAVVRQRGRRIARAVDMMEIGVILISFVVAGVLATKSRFQHTNHQYLSAAALLAVAAYLIVGRLRRHARERTFEPNLLGDLDRSIAQLDYHIRRIRTFPLWFCAPVFAALFVGFLARHDGKPAWMWLLVFAAFPFAIYVTRLELRCLVPRKRELEALRTNLSSEC